MSTQGVTTWNRKTSFKMRQRLEKFRNISKREQQLKTKYGIDLLEYHTILQKQADCCAICGKHKTEFTCKLSVDHDHHTGRVRGILCKNCNVALGMFEDNIEFLKKAIDYLMTKKNEEEIQNLSDIMEEMAKAPKEKMGVRERGEIGSYEKITAPYVLKFSKAERFDG